MPICRLPLGREHRRHLQASPATRPALGSVSKPVQSFVCDKNTPRCLTFLGQRRAPVSPPSECTFGPAEPLLFALHVSAQAAPPREAPAPGQPEGEARGAGPRVHPRPSLVTLPRGEGAGRRMARTSLPSGQQRRRGSEAGCRGQAVCGVRGPRPVCCARCVIGPCRWPLQWESRPHLQMSKLRLGDVSSPVQGCRASRPGLSEDGLMLRAHCTLRRQRGRPGGPGLSSGPSPPCCRPSSAG